MEWLSMFLTETCGVYTFDPGLGRINFTSRRLLKGWRQRVAAAARHTCHTDDWINPIKRGERVFERFSQEFQTKNPIIMQLEYRIRRITKRKPAAVSIHARYLSLHDTSPVAFLTSVLHTESLCMNQRRINSCPPSGLTRLSLMYLRSKNTIRVRIYFGPILKTSFVVRLW